MKKLGKLKLNEFREVDYSEMKHILGGTDKDGFYTCVTNTSKDGCSDETKGKACKKAGNTAGICSFLSFYGVAGQTDRCECDALGVPKV